MQIKNIHQIEKTNWIGNRIKTVGSFKTYEVPIYKY